MASFPIVDPLNYLQEDKVDKRNILPDAVLDRNLGADIDLSTFITDITISKDDPSIIFKASTGSDTDYWMGVVSDEDTTDDDLFTIGKGTTPGSTPFFKIDQAGIVYLGVASPALYLSPNFSTTNYSRLTSEVINTNHIKASLTIRSAGYGSVWNLLTYSANTGSTATRDVLALASDGNMKIVTGSTSGLTSEQGGTLEINGGNLNIWSARTINYVHSAGGSPDGAGTKYQITAFNSSTLTLSLGPTNANTEVSFFSGSATSRMDLDTNGNLIFNESGAAVDIRAEGDTDANLFVTDGSADTVQIGSATTADSAKFYVLGKISTSGEVEINGDLNHDGTNIGFFGTTPTTQQTELTDELTTITFTSPITPDYAIQDLTSVGGFGFVTSDEAQTLLSVVANLQTRVNELETKLTAYGLLIDAD